MCKLMGSLEIVWKQDFHLKGLQDEKKKWNMQLEILEVKAWRINHI